MSSSWSDVPVRVRSRIRDIVLRRDNYECQLRLPGCTFKADSVDHVRPRESAGDGPDNLRAACIWCNKSRGDPRRGDAAPLPFQ